MEFSISSQTPNPPPNRTNVKYMFSRHMINAYEEFHWIKGICFSVKFRQYYWRILPDILYAQSSRAVQPGTDISMVEMQLHC